MHAHPIPILPGELRWDPAKSLAWAVPTGLFLVFGPSTASVEVAVLLVGLLVLFLLPGHVVGFHRGLVHRGWRTFPAFERLLVVLGTLAGIAPLFDLVRAHDVRDHWQNQTEAPAVFAYDHSLATDFVWYLHCRWVPLNPQLDYEAPRRPDVHDVPFYKVLHRGFWLWQGLLALALFIGGGWAWVVWGVFGRLAIIRTGFWLVNHLAHTHGTVEHTVQGSREVGRNLWPFALISFGEAWHNNHHAWPNSAQCGVHWWQIDPAWRVIRALEIVGLAWQVVDVRTAPKRPA